MIKEKFISEEISIAERYGLKPGHIWFEGSPFRYKTAREVEELLIKKGFNEKGPNAIKDFGSFL